MTLSRFCKIYPESENWILWFVDTRPVKYDVEINGVMLYNKRPKWLLDPQGMILSKKIMNMPVTGVYDPAWIKHAVVI